MTGDPKYNDESDEEYRDIFYLYAHGLINSYNEWLSTDMLDSDTDEELIHKARDIKYYHEIYKHIDKYFEIKGNQLEIQAELLDENVKTHKELFKYVMMDEYGNIEVHEIIDRIADMGEVLYHDDNTIGLACICGANNYNNRENNVNDNYNNRENNVNDNYENENENNNYYTAEAGYYENYYEIERLSINNPLRNI